MNSIKLRGHVDEHHRLVAEVPTSVPPGPVDVELVLPADEDAAAYAWAEGVACEWAAELTDPREDIYTLSDGEPVNGAR